MSGRERLCVYSHSANGRIFYVGSGQPPRPYDRSQRTPRWKEYVGTVGDYQTTIHAWTNDRDEAKRLESELIATHSPPCNVRKYDTRNYGIDGVPGPTFSFRIDPDLRTALNKMAEAEDRSAGYIALRFIVDGLKKGGYLKLAYSVPNFLKIALDKGEKIR